LNTELQSGVSLIEKEEIRRINQLWKMDSKDKNYLSKETPLRDYYISYVNGSA